MAKVQSDSVYRIIDVVGVSETSWEDAGRKAVETAAGSLRDLRVAEVTKMDMKVDNGKVTAFRTRVALSFKYEVESFHRKPRSGRAWPGSSFESRCREIARR
jgi:dodecin